MDSNLKWKDLHFQRKIHWKWTNHHHNLRSCNCKKPVVELTGQGWQWLHAASSVCSLLLGWKSGSLRICIPLSSSLRLRSLLHWCFLNRKTEEFLCLGSLERFYTFDTFEFLYGPFQRLFHLLIIMRYLYIDWRSMGTTVSHSCMQGFYTLD